MATLDEAKALLLGSLRATAGLVQKPTVWYKDLKYFAGIREHVSYLQFIPAVLASQGECRGVRSTEGGGKWEIFANIVALGLPGVARTGSGPFDYQPDGQVCFVYEKLLSRALGTKISDPEASDCYDTITYRYFDCVTLNVPNRFDVRPLSGGRDPQPRITPIISAIRG